MVIEVYKWKEFSATFYKIKTGPIEYGGWTRVGEQRIYQIFKQ